MTVLLQTLPAQTDITEYVVVSDLGVRYSICDAVVIGGVVEGTAQGNLTGCDVYWVQTSHPHPSTHMVRVAIRMAEDIGQAPTDLETEVFGGWINRDVLVLAVTA